MEKETPEKPLLPPPPEEATNRMWSTTSTPGGAAPAAAAAASDIPEVKCDYCGAMVRMRRGQRCPLCLM